MSAFLLIRHATTEHGGQALAGRAPGVRLSARGAEEAEGLIVRLEKLPLTAIYSSPRERALDTAAPLARSRKMEVLTDEDFDEVDYGDWTGKSFAELSPNPRWRRYNSFRSGTRIPAGESFVEIQRRMVAGLERLRERHPSGVIAIFSHGDPIKTAAAYYAGIPLDLILRLEISRASISIISLTEDGARILCLNATGAVPAGLIAGD